MIVRTEYSFRRAWGTAKAALACLPEGGIICDDGAWGHVPWSKAGKEAKKPVGFGGRVRVGAKKNWRELIVVATSSAGLRDLYSLLGQASKAEAGILPPGAIAPGDWEIVAGVDRAGTVPELPAGALVPFAPGALIGQGVAFSDNYYPTVADRAAWLMALGQKAWTGTAPAHIMTLRELRAFGASAEAVQGMRGVMEKASAVTLPVAQNIRYPVPDPQAELAALCRAEAVRRNLTPAYMDRLERELIAIAEKNFADYFLVIAEMIAWAKERMLVGPGRGSSAGSIVCWLLRITEVDPIPHGLLFERFIDTNRADLPDIDIDFPDEGRESVLEHLAEKYGAQNVAHIGTIMRYKGKSALTDVAKELRVPPWELDQLKEVIVERSSGDARVNDCLRDTLATYDAGKALIAKYPGLMIACELEGGARQSGKHAAGMIICNEPVEKFCTVGKDGVAQIDKKSAEALNMLKIDALGLRTLSVLMTACEIAGIKAESLYAMPLDDAKTIEVFNARRFCGIFQFEGHAMHSLSQRIQFREFNDIVALTALARPGPLGGGEAAKWIDRHEGLEAPTPAHPLLAQATAETYGSILFQEQVMAVVREVGKFDWAQTSAVRKVMSDRKGDEVFETLREAFTKGAIANGVAEIEAAKLWRAINSMGSWTMNKSHCVVYGIVSYWCGYMKAHYPQAFAAGCLRHAKDTEGALRMLRELEREGIKWRAVDPEKSAENWTVVDGELLGGLTGLPGIGEKKARVILNKRVNGLEYTDAEKRLLAGRSVFADAFPTRAKWGDMLRHPENYNLSNPQNMKEIDQIIGDEEVYLVVKLMKKSLRDMNDDKFLKRRLGVRVEGPTKMLVAHFADDTGRIVSIVDRFRYEAIGAKVMEKGVAEKTWMLVRGSVGNSGLLKIQAIRWLEE